MLTQKLMRSRASFEGFGLRFASSSKEKEKLVILGSGWAGYNVARKVDKSLYDVTVVSPNSYFSFTPFLASTAVGTLEYRCATEPVRGIKQVNFAQGWASDIDFSGNTVKIEPALSPIHDLSPAALKSDHAGESGKTAAMETYDLGYDKLVIAVGCYSASFGIPGVAKHAKFLKDIRDAREIRTRLLECFEQASVPNITPSQRRSLLSFRIVGGGPTGVEFAAELHDLVHQDVYRIYPHLKGQVTITLYDVAPGILMSFDQSLREYAEKTFKRDGIVVKGGSKITAVGEDWIELDGEFREPYGLLVWSTGLQANPFVEGLKGMSKDEKTKSLKIDEHLRPLTENGNPYENVFAIGDNATPSDGTRLPATAQVASQMASHLSGSLNRIARGTYIEQTKGFKWKNKGSMVFIGEERALVDRSNDSIQGPKSRLSGFAAWVIWRSYYMTLAMGWRNKILVPIYWTLAWCFGRDVTRF